MYKKGVLIILCAVGSLLLTAAPGTVKAAEPINVGMINSFTGSLAFEAKEQENGAVLAVKEINKQGGVLGRQVTLLVRDDEARPDVGVRKLGELLQVNKVVALFGGISGAVALAVEQTAKPYRIPITGRSTVKSNQGPGSDPYRWGFKSEAIAGGAGAEYAVKNLGKKFYIFYADYVWGWDELYGFEKGLKKYEGEVIGKDATPPGTVDFAPFLTKALWANPDVLVLIHAGMDYVYSVKQAHDLGVKEKMKIYVPDASAYSSEKAIGPKAMEGVYLGTAFYWEAAMSYASGKKFVDDYQKEFGRKPSMQTYVAYAGALAWADAARIAKTLDGDAINNVWGSPGFSFDHGKGKVRWRVPDHTAIEDWYICRGRGPQAVAADPERILEVLKTTRGSEEYLYSLEELGYK